MITDIQKNNESKTSNSNVLEVLKKYFPSCFDKPDLDENGAVMIHIFGNRCKVKVFK